MAAEPDLAADVAVNTALTGCPITKHKSQSYPADLNLRKPSFNIHSDTILVAVVLELH